MPDAVVGRALLDAVGEPPHLLDPDLLLRRAQRRVRVRRGVVAASAALATGSVILVVNLLGPAGEPSSTPATRPPEPSPSTSGAPRAPDVRGMTMGAATAALTQADCETGIREVVGNPASVGSVIDQAEVGTPDLCSVALTVSAGPETPAPECTELGVTNDPLVAAAGHVGFAIHLRNAGGSLCSLSGYLRLTGEDGRGRPVEAAQLPDGYLGGWLGAIPPPRLRLRAGDQVSLLVEATDNPVGNATSCTTIGRLRLHLALASAPLTVSLPDCTGLVVHPLVPGTTGSVGPFVP